MALELNGTTGVQGNSGAFVAGTAVASTSGTSITFTSIPSWVKRVTLMLQGVTTSGSTLILQIGSGSIETSGYVSSSFGVGNTGNVVTATNNTAAFQLTSTILASGVYSGTISLTLLNSSTNIWTSSGNLSQTGGGFVGGYGSAGTKTITGGVLTQIKLFTNSGTDTFSAGSINILYE
jgi:hypothetical protein